VKEWIRAVESAAERETYPALPPYLAPGVVASLWSDPLWRSLWFWIRRLETGCPDWSRENAYQFQRRVSKVNRLASDSGLPGGVPFRMGGSGLRLTSPDGKKTIELERGDNGSLKPPGQDARDAAIACLTAWQDARGKQLAPASVDSDGKNESPRQSRKRIGRPPSRDPKKDAKLVADWEASDTKKQDFERARSLSYGEVRAAQDRIKSRSYRGRPSSTGTS
jgi:hypothetical protein